MVPGLPLQSPAALPAIMEPHIPSSSMQPGPFSLVGFPPPPSPMSPQALKDSRKPPPFAFSREVRSTTTEFFCNQTRVYQTQVMQRSSANMDRPCGTHTSLTNPDATPLNLALSQFVHAPTAPQVQAPEFKTLKPAPSSKKSLGAAIDSTLSQIMKSAALYCSLCSKTFTTQSGLQRHINTAHKEAKDKPFKCKECGKGFLSERTLKTHTNMHLGVYPYHCQFCNKGFPNQDNLKGHLASHTNIKEFKCGHCGQEFTYRTSLNHHIAKAHR